MDALLAQSPRSIPATHHIVGSHTELQGIPGAITTYQEGPTRSAIDVACPGCGEKVYHLSGKDYPMAGEVNGRVSLTCARVIRFVPCCPDSEWLLTDGVWHEQ